MRENDEFLEHHGVLGMKWGVRRYQNYDGSLTRAGMKRFQASKEAYEKADSRYKAAKAAYKQGKKDQKAYAKTIEKMPRIAEEKSESGAKAAKEWQDKTKFNETYQKNIHGPHTELVNAKLARKKANQKLVKDYKHLKQDKLADQGKNLYASGKTITSNNKVEKILGSLGSMSISALLYTRMGGKTGISAIDNHMKEIQPVLAGFGATSLASAGIVSAKNAYQNKRLRAYYSHTSNY